MKTNYQLFQKIKNIGWNQRQLALAESSEKLLSTYKINELLSVEQNWHEIAEKCSVNPNHEHFGKSAEEILSLWQNKGDVGSKRGNNLDDYITNKLKGIHSLGEKLDPILLAKCNMFDNFYDKYLSNDNVEYINSEIWLTHKKYRLTCRLDAAFLFNNEKLVVFDWKSNENIKTKGFNKMLGPLSHIDNSDSAKMTLQAYTYKYILESYDLGYDVNALVVNFLQLSYNNLKFAFEYSKELMEEIFEFAHEENARRVKKQLENEKTKNSKNKKLVLIINGRPTSGKDTFCENSAEFAKDKNLIVKNISSVDKVKEAAILLGWNGVKDSKGRDFLSALKDLSTKYYDGPFNYQVSYAEQNDLDMIFMHNREWSEIEKLKKHYSSKENSESYHCVTIFIDRNVEIDSTNHADNEVDFHKNKYDLIIDNSGTLEEYKQKAKEFINNAF